MSDLTAQTDPKAYEARLRDELRRENAVLRKERDEARARIAELENQLVYSAPYYEIPNLRAGLLTLRALGLDTGDWLGQILNRLPEDTQEPNRSVEWQVAEAHRTDRARIAELEAEVERLRADIERARTSLRWLA